MSRKLETAKGFIGTGQHRQTPPDETLKRIGYLAKACGVTRSADITRLDRTGIPVTSVVRPWGRTLSTTSGKGLRRIDAEVSGLMEAIEVHIAENFSGVDFVATDAEASESIVDLTRLPRQYGGLAAASIPIEWTQAVELNTQRTLALPSMLVGLCKDTRSGRRNFHGFPRNSNGLASGNTYTEAVLSGLLEVIERDAIACHTFACSVSNHQIPVVDLADCTNDTIIRMIEQMRSVEIMPVIHDCTIDNGVPVFMVYLLDNRHPEFGVAGGYGAHLDPAIALLRALTEAAQSRAVVIAGARDDVFSLDLQRIRASKRAPRAIDTGPVVAQSWQSRATGDLAQDLEILRAGLCAIGCEQIIVVDLAPELTEACVVRVVVPGLEGYRNLGYRPGLRALAFANQYMPRRAERFGQSVMHLNAGGRA